VNCVCVEREREREKERKRERERERERETSELKRETRKENIRSALEPTRGGVGLGGAARQPQSNNICADTE